MSDLDRQNKAFSKYLENLSHEELRRISAKEHERTERDFKEFRSAFEQNLCSYCGQSLSYFSEREPCLHWLLMPKGFKKKDFPALYHQKSFHEIEAYLRWVANTDESFKNINDLVEEKRSSKVFELTIRYKNLEWSFSCSGGDIRGHKGKYEGRMPHYHFQLKKNGNIVINYGGFHVPFNDYDQFVFAVKRGEFKRLKYAHTRGAGMQTLLDDVTPEELLEGMKTAGEDEDKGHFQLDTFVEAEPGTTISGDDIAALIKESKETGEPLAKLVKKLKNVRATTIITPGPAVPEIAKRKPRKNR